MNKKERNTTNKKIKKIKTRGSLPSSCNHVTNSIIYLQYPPLALLCFGLVCPRSTRKMIKELVHFIPKSTKSNCCITNGGIESIETRRQSARARYPAFVLATIELFKSQRKKEEKEWKKPYYYRISSTVTVITVDSIKCFISPDDGGGGDDDYEAPRGDKDNG